MNIKHFLLFGIILASYQGYGQSILGQFKNDASAGDKLYQELSYVAAIDAYKKALRHEEGHPDSVRVKIAESYRMLNDHENSVTWYKQAFDANEKLPAPYMLHYADELTKTKNYREAGKWYEAYATRTGSSPYVENKLQGIENQEKYFNNPSGITISKSAFNSPQADFSPAFYQEKIVFVSARHSDHRVKKIFNWDLSNFLDIYLAESETNVRPFDKAINSKYHEGPLVFYNNGNNVIFTRNYLEGGKILRSENGIHKLSLYIAEKINGKWVHVKPLPFNNKEYSVGHPAISVDGKTLYFISDMPGGLGGTDLYKSEWKDGAWQKPANLGEKINTPGNEMFPFLYHDTQLFFSSNGRDGLGGLDLYGSDLSSAETVTVLNLGAPLNSSLDDFGIILDSVGNGYFSSNRERGLNIDDIYSFNAAKPLLNTYTITGIVYAKADQQPLKNATVSLIKDNKVVQQVKTDDQGRYNFAAVTGDHDQVKAEKKDYHTTSVALNPADETRPDVHADVLMPNDYGFALQDTVSEEQGNPLPDVSVRVMDDAKEIFRDNTDDRGQFLYAGNMPLNFESIYFDFDKADLRADAVAILDKIVLAMKQDPSIKIELSSHTDSRGDANYNKALSQRRLQSSVSYLLKKGVRANQILRKEIWGETKLVNDCDDNKPCDEQQHQQNRRTELRISN